MRIKLDIFTAAQTYISFRLSQLYLMFLICVSLMLYYLIDRPIYRVSECFIVYSSNY